MHMTPRRAVAACAAIAVALLAQAPSLAQAAPTTAGTQGLAKGRLVHPDGTPAAGAIVTLYAMPVETAQKHYAEGASGVMAALGQYRTDRNGRYAAAVKRAALAPFRDPGGNVNIQMFARDARGANIASIGFGVEPVEPITGAAAATRLGRSAIASSPLVPVAINDLTLTTPDKSVSANSTRMALVPPTAKATGDPATRMGDPGNAPTKSWIKPMSAKDSFVNGAGATGAVASPTLSVCMWNLVKDLGNRTVWVGGTYVKATGVTADLAYNNGASSSLGMGVSTSGKYGSFSASGTRSVASNGSVDFPTNTGFQHDYTQFRYGKYGYSCDSSPGFRKYNVQARYWVGGATTYAPSLSPTANYCMPYQAGAKATQETSTAYEFSTGADISGAIGIDLSSRSGYSKAVKTVFTFKSTRKLCGTNGYPGQSPKRLVAKA